MTPTRRGTYADVARVDALWVWDCRICQAGEPHGSWRAAYDTARWHLATHRRFGFQPRRGPTPRGEPPWPPRSPASPAP